VAALEKAALITLIEDHVFDDWELRQIVLANRVVARQRGGEWHDPRRGSEGSKDAVFLTAPQC